VNETLPPPELPERFMAGPLVMTVSERTAAACKRVGYRHAIDASHPRSFLDGEGVPLHQVACFQSYIILTQRAKRTGGIAWPSPWAINYARGPMSQKIQTRSVPLSARPAACGRMRSPPLTISPIRDR